MERQLRMKKVITVIAVCLLIAVYIMIFLFSADDAAESSSLSVAVTRKLMNLYYHFYFSFVRKVFLPVDMFLSNI